ncbi:MULTISPECIES: hypothetical protein [Calothrix]|uniref:Uncharacterized protein n=2 Tax=Calothrix TaxID=1186 RepID=A0ABR8AED4_9CYAN|nr:MULTISPECIES: hypothetical protein [Calothrix]MBD2198387.1 hypothetical protein [Calothrix parietina FACHB-288]MBD2226712.1 hypothetical protein [Calothrix anomala FACHB-343]MBD2341784.1 hypothetical protein [Calothrix sp. FACHB-156]
MKKSIYIAIAHQHPQIKTADSLISYDRTPASIDKNSRFLDFMRTTYVAQASHRTYQICW